MAKIATPAVRQTASKFSPKFWLERIFRPRYIHEGERREVSEWHARIQLDGERRYVGLGSNNREEASRKAAKFYQTMRAKGWDAAVAELNPDAAKPKRCMTTIGDYLAAVQPLAKVRPRSWDVYAYALRKIALAVSGDQEKGTARFDPKTLVLRERADRVPLSILTSLGVEQWKADFISGRDPMETQRARRSANSYVRNARALFSRRILKRLAELSIPLPSPLPFEGVELERQGNTRYVSTVDAAKLLRAARRLAKKDSDAWRVILLALGAGLRRSEIDMLCWSQIDLKKAEVRILNHANFEAKTDDSQGRVFVDPGLLAQLGSRPSRSDQFVIEAETTATRRKGQYYRCQATFETVTAWLRKKGVNSDRPLHTLRKEFGSIIAEKADIHTASRQLRHSNIATTAAYYTDHRKRETVGIGEMLKAKPKTRK